MPRSSKENDVSSPPRPVISISPPSIVDKSSVSTCVTVLLVQSILLIVVPEKNLSLF